MTKRILINNNEPSYQTLEQGLNHYGYETIVADDDDDLLLLAITKSPDLILIDMHISEAGSWQTIKTLKQSKITWLIPVIAIANRTVDGELLVQAGFDAYYRKPISLRHLLLRIEALLDIAPEMAKPLPSISPAGKGSLDHKLSSTQKPPASNPLVYVEDSPMDSQAMAKIVQKAGYSYVNISDSLQALPELLELKPQLIFIDLVMPMANGYELCAQIRRMTVFKKTPIVIVTNNNGIADRIRSRLVGAYGFLHKPVIERRVLKILKKYGCQPNIYAMLPEPNIVAH